MEKFTELSTEELNSLKGGLVIDNYTIDPWPDDDEANDTGSDNSRGHK